MFVSFLTLIVFVGLLFWAYRRGVPNLTAITLVKPMLLTDVLDEDLRRLVEVSRRVPGHERLRREVAQFVIACARRRFNGSSGAEEAAEIRAITSRLDASGWLVIPSERLDEAAS